MTQLIRNKEIEDKMFRSLLPHLYSLQSIYSVKSLKFCAHKHNLPLQVETLKKHC